VKGQCPRPLDEGDAASSFQNKAAVLERARILVRLPHPVKDIFMPISNFFQKKREAFLLLFFAVPTYQQS